MMAEDLDENESSDSVVDDHLQKGLEDVFELEITDLSEKVDGTLYQLDEEE